MKQWMDYLSEVINGEPKTLSVTNELIIHFSNENELSLVDPTNNLEYKLQRVE